MYPLDRPQVMVPVVQDKMGGDGWNTSGKTRQKVGQLREALVTWTRRTRESQHTQRSAYWTVTLTSLMSARRQWGQR